MSTIIDVAKLAGTSPATVSRVINNKPVRPENYDRVTAAIKELRFEANASARSLKTKKTWNIGMVVPFMDFFYFMRIMKYAQQRLEEQGYSVMIMDSEGEQELEKEKVKKLMELNVDGFIIVLSENDCSYINEIASGMPVVLCDKVPNPIHHDVVVCDGANIVYKSVELLIKNGHENIGIICGPQVYYTAQERLKGYLRALEDYHYPIKESLVKYVAWDTKHGVRNAYDTTRELLNETPRPTALIASNYDLTKGSLLYMQDEGIKIPEEVSFVGYDFEELYEFYNPKMSMIFEDFEELGAQAARLLLRQLQSSGNISSEIVRVKSRLVLGDSIKKLK